MPSTCSVHNKYSQSPPVTNEFPLCVSGAKVIASPVVNLAADMVPVADPATQSHSTTQPSSRPPRDIM